MKVDWTSNESVVRAANESLGCQTHWRDGEICSVYLGHWLGLGKTWAEARHSPEKIYRFELAHNPDLMIPERPSQHEQENCTHDTLRYYTFKYVYAEDFEEYANKVEEVIRSLAGRTVSE